MSCSNSESIDENNSHTGLDEFQADSDLDKDLDEMENLENFSNEINESVFKTLFRNSENIKNLKSIEYTKMQDRTHRQIYKNKYRKKVIYFANHEM